MPRRTRTIKHRCNQLGAATAEIGPALFILLVMVLPPTLDLAGLAFSYGAGWYLNYLQAREAAVSAEVRQGAIVNNAEITSALADVQASWRGTSLCRFTAAEGVSEHFQLVGAGKSGSSNGVRYIEVVTAMQVKPFITVPFFKKVPGLGAPVLFSFTGVRPVEDVF